MKNQREDFKCRELAESLGWTVELHCEDVRYGRKVYFDKPEECPQWCLTFKKGQSKVILLCIDGWACADISQSPKHYVNHRYNESLEETLKKESK